MFERVQKIMAAQLNIPKEKIKPETRILEDLSADSLDMIEMITEMESEFGISISDEQIAAMHTVADVVSFCTKQQGK